MGCFGSCQAGSGQFAVVKSFGHRQAYESPRGRNPRATDDGYGDFGFRHISTMAETSLRRAEIRFAAPPGDVVGPAGRGSVGVDDHHEQAWIRCWRLCAYDLRLDRA